MFKSRSQTKPFYCRRENSIVAGCPLGEQLVQCPLRLYCQAWRQSVGAPVVAAGSGVFAKPRH